MERIMKKELLPKEFKEELQQLCKCRKAALRHMVEINYRIIDTSQCSKDDLISILLEARGWFVKVKPRVEG